ncbi:MAG: phage coat protein [Clostridiales bacterium]|nr:phage coat protein [Clostridiales bacterium]
MAGSKFDSKSFNPQAFGKYIDTIPQLKKNELLKSRALTPNSQIREAFSSQTGTAYAVLPMYGLLDGDVLNYDGQTDITATSTTTYERGVVVTGRAKAWTEMDFSEDITGGAGFMSNVAAQVSEYWEAVDQSILLSILNGIFNMTGAKNLEFVNNHTYDITETGDGVMTPSTLNTAIQKAGGDNKNKFKIAIMHSAVATNLENLNLLSYLKQTDANGIQRDLTLATWNGRTVIIDDSMPVEETAGDEGSDSGAKYTTYILGEGAFDYESIGAKIPYEMSRDPKTNGGVDTLYSRQRKVYAPYGISYIKKSQATLSPTNEELENGANWELVNDGNETASKRKYINHKAIPIAKIISKG